MTKSIAQFQLSLSLLIAIVASPAMADPNGPSAALATPAAHQDPYLPPAARQPTLDTPSSGDALRGKVREKLQRQFDAADIERTGTITQAQARSSGWGFVSNHFAEIDAAHRGAVSFDQIAQFMRSRGANF